MSGGVHAVAIAPPLLLWAASLYKLPALSRGRDQPAHPALAAYWSAIAWLGVAMTLLVPPLAAGLDRVLHVPNAAWLLLHAAVLLSGFSATIALLHEAPGSQTHRAERGRRCACGGLIAALTVLFAIARLPFETDDFVLTYGEQPAVSAFLALFYAGLAFVCVDMAPRSWRAARTVNGLLQLGLYSTASAAGLSLAFIAYNATVIVQLATGHAEAIVGDPLTISRVLLLVIVSLIAIGTSAPDWGHHLHLDVVVHSLSHYRARRRLFTLWFDVRGAVPAADVASPSGRLRPLPPQRWSRWLGQRHAAALRDMLTFRDATFQLHRRVVDVTDGRLALTGYQDPALVDQMLATLPQGAADSDAAEAAYLAAGIAGITAMLGGQPDRAGDDSANQPPGALDGWSLQDEVDHLIRVTRYYRGFQARLLQRRANTPPTNSPAASSHT